MSQQQQFPFSQEFKKRIIALCLKNPEFFLQAKRWIEPEFFGEEMMVNLVRWIFDYHSKYKSIPTDVALIEVVKQEDPNKNQEYEILIKELFGLVISDVPFIKQKIKDWIQRNKYVRSLMTSQDLYNAGKQEEAYQKTLNDVREINTLTFDPPKRSFFFEEFKDREETRRVEALGDSNKFTTGIGKLDEITGGGLGVGELGIVFGDKGSGKSIALVHFGASCVRAYAGKVLHIILEGSLTQTRNRYDSRLAAYNYNQIKRGDMPNEVFHRLENEYEKLKGNLVIREMLDEFEYTPEHVETEILDLEAHGFHPNLLIVDYGDLLTPRTKSLKSEIYLAQREIFNDLRILGNKYRAGVWSASQSTRPKGKEEDPTFVMTSSNMSDSYHKPRLADLVISLNRTTAERKAGMMRLWVDKYRDDECKLLVPLRNDFSKMQFSFTDPI